MNKRRQVFQMDGFEITIHHQRIMVSRRLKDMLHSLFMMAICYLNGVIKI